MTEGNNLFDKIVEIDDRTGSVSDSKEINITYSYEGEEIMESHDCMHPVWIQYIKV